MYSPPGLCGSFKISSAAVDPNSKIRYLGGDKTDPRAYEIEAARGGCKTDLRAYSNGQRMRATGHLSVLPVPVPVCPCLSLWVPVCACLSMSALACICACPVAGRVAEPLRHCITVSLYHCIIVSLYHCIIVSVYHCITVSLYHCISATVSSLPIRKP